MGKRAEKGKMRISRDDRAARIKGFTLVELMFVFLLLGFMLLLTFPNFREFFSPRNMKRAILGFVGTLRYAQNQAATTKHRYRLNMDVKENAFWITVEDEKGKFVPDPSSHGQRTFLPAGVVFLDIYHPERGKVRDGAAYVEFFPTGWADECTIHLQRSEEEIFTFFVHPLGGKVEVVAGYSERLKG
jgi:type II secretory pathway pseudopilin PulG